MDTKKDISIFESLRKLKFAYLLYPGISILFLIVVAVVFFFAIQFLSRNINEAFSPEVGISAPTLDMEKYQLVTKKLGLVTAPANNAPISDATGSLPSQAVATGTPEITVLDKQSITILIKNSTPTKGAAAALVKALEGEGFAKAKTGNEQNLYATTTILLKKSKGSYEPLLFEAVRKLYPKVTATTAPEASTADATIIIGTH